MSLDPYAFRIAVWLASHADGYEENVTRNSIAARLKISSGKVSAAVATLVTAGIIELETIQIPQGEGGKRWVIWFDHAVWEGDPGHVVTRVDEARSCGDQAPVMARPGPGHVVTASTRTTEEDQENNTAAPSLDLGLAPPAVERVEVADRFDEFWSIYPRTKDGKAPAQRAWAKAMKDKVDPQVIIDAAIARGRWWEQAKTPHSKRPHASTWLNDRRWTDEIGSVEVAAITAAGIDKAIEMAQVDEMDAAIARGDFDGAWQIVRDKAQARGEKWFITADNQIARGGDDATVAIIADVSVEQVAKVRALRQVMSERARSSSFHQLPEANDE